MGRVGQEILKLVPKPKGFDELRKMLFVTNDIIELILIADKMNATNRPLKNFVQYLFKNGMDDEALFKFIWYWVRSNIIYKKDADFFERVKLANVTIHDGFADCKGMSLVIGSILRELGYSFKYRFTAYNRRNEPTHVYIIATGKNGKEYSIDAVFYHFDKEPSYTLKTDFEPIVVPNVGYYSPQITIKMALPNWQC
jgi:hypothetical protein